MKDYVLDTSVVLKWYRHRDESYVDNALLLLDDFSKGNLLIHIPELVFYELGNALRMKQDITLKEKIEYLGDFYALGLEVYPVTENLALKAITIAQKYNLTFYDACFLSLSEILDCPFITADEKLYQKLEGVEGIAFIGMVGAKS